MAPLGMYFKGVRVGKILRTTEDLMAHSYPLMDRSPVVTPEVVKVVPVVLEPEPEVMAAASPEVFVMEPETPAPISVSKPAKSKKASKGDSDKS